ncbi:MAG: type II glyceraldehyde-3-phosphate dehydrogenase [Thermoplasmataceae archaeon]
MIKVGINGYGTIGRRVADAVRKQPDMTVVGVVKAHPDYVAVEASRNHKLYVPDDRSAELFDKAGLKVHGTVQDLISAVDIIVDATPEGMGEKNLPLYRKAGVKAIFEGGEAANAVQGSFNAYSNFDEVAGMDYIRVVSCNTTGLARSLSTLKDNYGLESVSATLIRRATDPNDHKHGPLNALEPSLKFPSHHGPDVLTVLHGFEIDTSAVKAPTTLMHVHVIDAVLKKEASREDILKAFASKRRILTVSGARGIVSTAQIMDLARERGRDRSDMYEIAVWEESVNLKGKKLHYMQAVHQESDVVPENIDAIRAAINSMGKEESIETTDRTMGIGKLVD